MGKRKTQAQGDLRAATKARNDKSTTDSIAANGFDFDKENSAKQDAVNDYKARIRGNFNAIEEMESTEEMSDSMGDGSEDPNDLRGLMSHDFAVHSSICMLLISTYL